MNSSKSYYYMWVLVLLTCIAIGFIYFTEDTSSKNKTDTNEIKTIEQPANLSQKESTIQQLRNSLNVDQKIGQIILAKVPEINQIQDIQTYGLGGYLIFSKDVDGESVDSFKAKINSWQTSSNIPMIIASDEEGGVVTRVSPILPEPFTAIGELYAAGGLPLLQTKEAQKAAILKSLGINVNLGPVADVAINPASFIFDRTLELPPETDLIQAANITSQYVTLAVQEFKKAQEGSCLKHFPGYGENADSHSNLVVDQRSLDVLQKIDFIPFQAGINAGAGGILISHNICTALDPTEPASVSPAVHDILRNNFHFNGVIFCDDLDMSGMTKYKDQSQAAVATLNAGTDMIICSNYNSIIPTIKQEIANGTISQERLDEAVDHVLSWKYDLGLL